jgi:hypothetical protein
LKSLTLTGRFFLIFITKVLVLLNITLAFSASPGDSIKPLTQVNKEFLVVAHIVYNADTIAGIDSATIVTALASTNFLFAPIGVSFKLCKVDYIYNFQFDMIDDTKFTGNRDDLLSQFWVANRINLFYVSSLSGPNGLEGGDADLGGITSSQKVGIVIVKGGAALTHEMGHYFNLSHTFGDPPPVSTELVNGSNCAISGDSICDTPADPYTLGSNYVDGNCSFIYTGKDANGDYYDPDVSNIMSYYGGCRCKFTYQQYERMAKYYLSNPIEW